MSETYVVIDMGYGYTKVAVLTEGEQIGPISCPSAFALTGRILTERARAARPRLQAPDGKTYYWGDYVRYSANPVFSRERKRPLEMLLVLFLGLLSELTVSERDPTPLVSGDVRILTGLPVEWLDDAERARLTLSGRHAATRLDTGAEIGVNVQSVEVYPQPQCAFMGRADQDASLWNDWVTALVVDIGTGTSNVSFIDGGTWIDERARSIPYGMGLVLEQALQAQETQQGGRDLLLTARAKLWGREAEMMHYVAGPLQQLAARVAEIVADVVGDALVTVSILAGGGARFLEPHLDLPGQVSVTDSPEMDNVHGLLAIARTYNRLGSSITGS
jgi:hypothetical protein